MDYNDYRGPIRFENRRGQVRYQPTLSTGERMYEVPDLDDWVSVWINPTVGLIGAQTRPLLCRWRKAANLAVREARRRKRVKDSAFREVQR